MTMNNPWDIPGMGSGQAPNSQGGLGAGAYPTFSNPYGIGSQNPFGAQGGPTDQAIPGALAGTNYMEKPISEDKPQTASIGFNPWSMSGEATARDA